ncbi:MAG: hypothetical protein ACEQSR_12075 [Candidatus Methylacidiphilales bacterium]
MILKTIKDESHCIAFSNFNTCNYLLIGCKNEQKDTIETVFFTQDSLYKITFDKPLELDTFYAWRKEGCYGCDDSRKYCFSKSKFPVEMQSGLLFNNFADSIYRLITEHIDHFKCKSTYNFELSLRIRKNLLTNLKAASFDADTLFIDNVRSNLNVTNIYGYKTKTYESDSNWRYAVHAITEIDSNLISFAADCRSKNCDGFIDRFEKTIKSIKIERYK